MKIILACGGTGGHIFPAFSVAEEIKRRYPNASLIYVYGKKDIESAIFSIVSQEKRISIESAPFRGSASLLNPVFLLKLFQGCWKSIVLLFKEKPDLVAGFGGHYSFPVIMAAWILRVPAVIHEQNVVPGKANRILARFVKKIALSFPETEKYFSVQNNFQVTGNPIRSSIERDCRKEALDFFKFKADKLTLLVLGGSQGAESINILFLEALRFLNDAIKQKIQILHLCGKMSPITAQEVFDQAQVDGQAFSFFERMDLAYGAADFVIGRAGATFLAEAKAKNIPAILIPYPFADSHQIQNAKAFCLEVEGVIKEQARLTGEELARTMEEWLSKFDKNHRGGPRHEFNTNRLPNARVRLANCMLEMIAQ